MHTQFKSEGVRVRTKKDVETREDAVNPQASLATRDSMTMATSTKQRNLVRLAAAAGVATALFAVWLWWPRTGGISIPDIPLMGHSKLSVTISQGTYVGIEAKSDFPHTLEQFLGIPYAQSTAGQNRFKPPVAIGASDEIFRASEYGHRCPGGEPNDNPHEDCLNLNIYRPKERGQGKLLPVLIYIHGGSFNFGHGHNRDIANMVGWSTEPFIGVSFNYRLGAFGFLSSSVTADEELLNMGLKDQALLFEWVQKHIASFGGNPDDVTIMGSSAGAHSVGHHLMRNFDSRPPFHKAILESGATTARVVYPPTHVLHEEHFESFISHLGLDRDSIPKDQLISTLHNLSTSAIKAASEAVFQKYNPSIRWPFQPVIDGPGGIIPIPPIDAWEAGNWTKIPILAGFNTNEGSMFVPKKLSTDEQFSEFFHTLLPGLSPGDLTTLAQTYPDPVTHLDSKYLETRPPSQHLGAQFKRLEQAYAHFAYVAPVRQMVRYASEGPAPVYAYRFAVNGSVVGGTDHGDQIDFVTYARRARESSERLGEVAGSMYEYWTSFITRGDPNAVKGRYPDRPKWPAYTTAEPKMAVFGEGNDERADGGREGTAVSVADNSWALDECKFWWERTRLFES